MLIISHTDIVHIQNVHANAPGIGQAVVESNNDDPVLC